MKHILCICILAGLFFSCKKENAKDSHLIASPSKNIDLFFDVNSSGQPFYTVNFNGKKVIDTSFIGNFEAKDFNLKDGFSIVNSERRTINEQWEQPWGEQRMMKNNCEELKYYLETKDKKMLNIIFRVFDDGIGFRYEIPQQNNLDSLLILDETTEFALTEDLETWWIPGDWDIYEHLYSDTKFSEIDALSKRDHPSLNATYIPENAVNTPVTQKSDNGYYLSFHEADLTNYPGMTLKVDKENQKWISELVGSDRLQAKAKIPLPFATPWRTILIVEKPGDLIESRMVLNLNDPNEIGDVSYFTPMKYDGIWWAMHIGTATWDYKGSQNMAAGGNTQEANKPHGATTENAKKYIDFAAANGLGGMLVEGWNTGWDKWLSGDREGVFDFITPYPDYDFNEVRDYAKSKGVQIIMHHETSSAPRTYEKQMDEAFQFMVDNDIHVVKTGYVGPIIPKGEYHHGQWMVNHYQRVIDKAAKYKIAVNAHEPIKDTGLRRTYPNFVSREGARGQEFNAWASDGGNPPSHIPTLAYTRMLSGPFDFTPGVFNITLDGYGRPNNRINTTIAQQLGLYVVIYSPVEMACDLPENYLTSEGTIHPMFQFIKDVGVDWETTKVLDGDIGQFVVTAREERGKGNWFVGAANGNDARDVDIDFSFLPNGQTFQAIIYKDSQETDLRSNPTAYAIEKAEISSKDKMTIHMVSGGGFAISLMK